MMRNKKRKNNLLIHGKFVGIMKKGNTPHGLESYAQLLICSGLQVNK